jgi:hypothetical protein
MKNLVGFALVFVMAALGAAYADPVGVYNVEGHNPGSGSRYEGIVEVLRTGDTYSVQWRVGDSHFVGTGIGAANVKGTATFGDAAYSDSAIAVSYASGSSFGLALFVEQDNGQWKGIWTYAGSEAIGSEVWTRP